MASEFKTESEDRFKSMKETISAYNESDFSTETLASKYRRNIETLTKMGLEGNGGSVVQPIYKYVQRDLIVRWGIDGYATRVLFKVSHYCI